MRSARFDPTIGPDVIRCIALGISLLHAGTVGVPTAAAPTPRLWGPGTTALTPEQTEQADALAARLRAAEEAALSDPATAEQLGDTLAEVREVPGLAARSPEVLDARMYALLTLARIELASGEAESAAQTIDEAIRTARGDALPTSGMTPELRSLYQERLTAPANRPAGTLQLTCEVPCRAIVNERQAGSGHDILLTGLPLGRHRLHVEAIEPGIEPMTKTVAFTEQAAEQSVTFGATPLPDEPAVASLDTGSQRDETTRKFPRWAGIVGITASAAMLTAGAVLLAFDERCPDGGDPRQTPCPNVLETSAAGITLTVTGAVALIGFSIALGISEKRHRRKNQATRWFRALTHR